MTHDSGVPAGEGARRMGVAHLSDRSVRCTDCCDLGCANCTPGVGVVDGESFRPFEEWLDGWLRAHPDVRTYDKEAMRDAFKAGSRRP